MIRDAIARLGDSPEWRLEVADNSGTIRHLSGSPRRRSISQGIDGKFIRCLPGREALGGWYYFFLPDPKFGCQPAAAPFWLGAAAMVLIFSFLGFLDSRLPFCSLLAMPLSRGWYIP
jgi:hypothetical protein